MPGDGGTRGDLRLPRGCQVLRGNLARPSAPRSRRRPAVPLAGGSAKRSPCPWGRAGPLLPVPLAPLRMSEGPARPAVSAGPVLPPGPPHAPAISREKKRKVRGRLVHSRPSDAPPRSRLCGRGDSPERVSVGSAYR